MRFRASVRCRWKVSPQADDWACIAILMRDGSSAFPCRRRWGMSSAWGQTDHLSVTVRRILWLYRTRQECVCHGSIDPRPWMNTRFCDRGCSLPETHIRGIDAWIALSSSPCHCAQTSAATWDRSILTRGRWPPSVSLSCRVSPMRAFYLW